jgi:phage terminase large subunit-like protein
LAAKNSNRGDMMIRFMETLRVPEGMHAGQPLVLRHWQKGIIRAIYNPVDSKGVRIVRKGIYSVAKKNGKTPLVAGLALGHLIGPEAKKNEQIYSAAYDRDQAAITFRYMRQMVFMEEELSAFLVVRESTKEIYCPRNGSIFKALSSEVKGKHGLGPAVLIMDELAQFGADRTFYDTLQQGRGAHLEPLLWIISTQAADDLAVLSQELDYGQRVEAGEIHDPTVRCFMFATPPEADPYDEASWRLSNPALGDFLNLADMQEAARTAQAMPSAEANFRNLRLNQRIDAESNFITPDIWKACGEPPNLNGTAEWWGGLDLSGKNDLTALILAAQDEEGNWHIRPFLWAPDDNLREKEKRDGVPYCLWRDKGILNTTPGKSIDYAFVAMKIGEIREEFDLIAINFDRWRIFDLQRELDKIGIESWIEGQETPISGGLCLVPHGQGFKGMNKSIETLEDLLMNGRIRHGNHPILSWCANNVRIAYDEHKNRKFNKKKSTGRIDGIVAMAMALDGAQGQVKTEQSIYETEGILRIGIT